MLILWICLNPVLSIQLQTIRLQRQKLTELKRALGQGLRSNAPFSSSATLNEDGYVIEILVYANYSTDSLIVA